MQALIQQQAEQLTTESATVQQLRAAAEQNNIQSDELIEHIAKLQNQIKEGLLDTTGTGTNANVIKLTKELRETIKKGARDDSRASREVRERAAPRPSPNESMVGDLEQRTRESTTKYNRTNADAFRDLKKTFSVEGFFDFSPGKKRGLFGNVLANKVARDQYVRDQMQINPNMKNMKQFGGDEEKVKKYWGTKYNEQQKIRGTQKETQDRIDELKARGYSDDEIKRTGLLAKRASLDDQLAVADKRYGKQRDQGAEQAQSNTRSAKENNVVPLVRATPDAAPQTVSAVTEEVEQENLRMMQEQNDLLKKIEENTRVLGIRPKEEPPTPTREATPSGGGGLGSLGDLDGLRRVGRAAGRGIRSAGSLLKRAGPGLMRAGATAARFAGPAAAVAAAGYTGYKAGQWLNENTSVQENIATGIEKVKGVFGASEEDKMKEVEQNTAQASYDKRVASGGKINQGLANMYKSQGVEVDESLIVSNEEWAKLDPATGKPKTEAAATPSNAPPGWEMGPDAKSYKVLPLEEAAEKGSSFQEVTPATPVTPAPVAGPAAAPRTPEGAIPVKRNNVLIGHMDPQTNEIAPLPGMEKEVEHMKAVRTSISKRLQSSQERLENISAQSPQGADNLVRQTNEMKQVQEEKASRETSKPPVVISAPTQTNIQQNSTTAIRNPARNTESSLSQFNSGKYRFL